MTSPNIHVDLSDLALRPGERYERAFALDVAPILLGGERYQVLVPEGVTLVVDRVAGGYLVNVSTDGAVYGPCARCLREAVLPLRAEEQEFVPTSKDGWDEADLCAFVREMVVDVSGLAREAIVLATPSRIVCNEACLGLCPECGRDRNQGPCACPAPGPDDRWAKLKDFAGDNLPSP